MSVEYVIADCLEWLPTLPDNSVDLIIADPPYYKIKSDEWDNQWKTFDEYLQWLEQVSLELKRVLKNNGSLYMFGDDHRIAYIQVMLDKHFTFLNHLVWYKRNNISIKYAHNNRKYTPVSERILFYSIQDATGLERVMLDTNNFRTLRQYFKDFQNALGISLKQINSTLGHRKAEHAFYWNSTQWDLPTPETYAELLKLPRNGDFIPLEYEQLRLEYEQLRLEYEQLRRPFNYEKGMYEVFDIPIIGGKENTDHPTTKPSVVIRQLILNSSNPDALVLDPFLGSGTTLRACLETGRNGIGCEKNQEYEHIIKERIRQANIPLTEFMKPEEVKT